MVFRTDRHEILAQPYGHGRRTGTRVNTVAFLAKGKKVAEGWDISPEDVIAYLETLPAGHVHCAELAVGAFYRALADYNSNQRHTWKKLYKTR